MGRLHCFLLIYVLTASWMALGKLSFLLPNLFTVFDLSCFSSLCEMSALMRPNFSDLFCFWNKRAGKFLLVSCFIPSSSLININIYVYEHL